MEQVVFIIANKLKETLGDSLVSVSVHGSFAQDSQVKDSDIDYFIILKDISLDILLKIREFKGEVEKKHGRELSLNVQKESELPKLRQKAFYHKNRYALFLHEANKIDKIIIGKNPYEVDVLPSIDEIRLEAVRIINSFAYFLRKYIVNSSLDFSVKEAIRYVIMATQYANAFKGEYPLKTEDSIGLFVNGFCDFKLKGIPEKFYKLKGQGLRGAKKSVILAEGLMFLESLDEYLFKEFERAN